MVFHLSLFCVLTISYCLGVDGQPTRRSYGNHPIFPNPHKYELATAFSGAISANINTASSTSEEEVDRMHFLTEFSALRRSLECEATYEDVMYSGGNDFDLVSKQIRMAFVLNAIVSDVTFYKHSVLQIKMRGSARIPKRKSIIFFATRFLRAAAPQHVKPQAATVMLTHGRLATELYKILYWLITLMFTAPRRDGIDDIFRLMAKDHEAIVKNFESKDFERHRDVFKTLFLEQQNSVYTLLPGAILLNPSANQVSLILECVRTSVDCTTYISSAAVIADITTWEKWQKYFKDANDEVNIDIVAEINKAHKDTLWTIYNLFFYVYKLETLSRLFVLRKCQLNCADAFGSHFNKLKTLFMEAEQRWKGCSQDIRTFMDEPESVATLSCATLQNTLRIPLKTYNRFRAQHSGSKKMFKAIGTASAAAVGTMAALTPVLGIVAATVCYQGVKTISDYIVDAAHQRGDGTEFANNIIGGVLETLIATVPSFSDKSCYRNLSELVNVILSMLFNEDDLKILETAAICTDKKVVEMSETDFISGDEDTSRDDNSPFDRNFNQVPLVRTLLQRLNNDLIASKIFTSALTFDESKISAVYNDAPFQWSDNLTELLLAVKDAQEKQDLFETSKA